MKKVIKSMWSQKTGELRIYIQINEITDDVSFEVQQDINKELTKGWHFPKYSQALNKFKALENVKEE